MPEEKSICPPFIRHGEKSRTVMLDVLLALLPALIWSIYIFGARAAVLCAVGIAFAVDRKSTRLNSSHIEESRMPSSA